MKMQSTLGYAVAAAALLALSGTASAQTTVTASTDLNIRSGPGPEYPVVGVIGANEEATLEGCLEGSKWCTITTDDGTQGWSYSDYLTASFASASERVIVTERPPEAVPVVTYEETGSIGDGSGVAGRLVGRIAADGTIERIDTPPPPVRTYVRDNRLDPVYLDGEVVVGAGLPETVEIREIPDYEYRYVYVNGQPVLVEPESRRIVHIIRE